jgi:hypothetical protein
VAADADGAATGPRVDLRRRRLAAVDLAAGDDDVGTRDRQAFGHRTADAATAAGDDRDLAG